MYQYLLHISNINMSYCRVYHLDCTSYFLIPANFWPRSKFWREKAPLLVSRRRWVDNIRKNPKCFFFHGATASSGPSPLHHHTQWDTPHSVGFLWMSDWLIAETSTWQHATLTTDRHPYPPPAGFEPAIPASERPKTHDSDRAATGIG